MEPVECRAARAALRIGIRELAALAGLSPDTVARFERGEMARARTIRRMRCVLEGRGITFMTADASTPGPGIWIGWEADAT